MKFQSVENLKKLLARTPKSTLDKLWEEVEAMELSGPTSDELILQQSLVCDDAVLCEASIDQTFIIEDEYKWNGSALDALGSYSYGTADIRVADESNYALAA